MSTKLLRIQGHPLLCASVALTVLLMLQPVSAQNFYANFEDDLGVNNPALWVPDNGQQNWTIDSFPGSGNGLMQTVEGCGVSGNTPLPGVTNFTDGIIQLDMSWGDDDSWGVIFRKTSDDAGYLVTFGYIETPSVIIADLADGCGATGQCNDGTGCENGGNELIQVPHDLPGALTQDLTASYTGRIEVRGNTIRVWFLPTADIAADPLGDFGDPLIEFQDSAHPGPGTVGIWHESQGGSMIDNVIVMTGDPALASGPLPVDGAIDVLRNTNLRWTAGEFAETHDVYFGTNFDDVNDASRGNPGDVLVSQGQADTSYALDRLELGQTYFWRIDEVNAAPDNTIHKGPTWSFTVEPVSYPLPGSSITATASSSTNATSLPEKTIDGSGLDQSDGHSTNSDHTWLSASPDTDPWLQYEFDGIYKLDRMLLWNGNQLAESSVGWGVKDVLVETSVDGETWTAVEGITQFTQAPGTPGTGPTDDFDLDGITAKYVRISIVSNYGGLLPQYNISEVRFYYIPVQAREPVPAIGAIVDGLDVTLAWRGGREASSHDVFVDTDANAVLDGSAPTQTVTDNSFGLASLDLPIGETYYWKVNEVNDAEDPSTWEGPLWNFVIPDPLIVDDFESYNNTVPSRPYVTWRDGLPYSNPAPGDSGNGTGAIVGHDIFSPGSPFFDGDLMELSLVHGGTQSLPLYYDNSGNGGNEPYSEMTRTFASPQDWSGNAIATLTLYFRGVEGNTGQLYVKINDTKIVFTDDPGAISRAMWEQWNIDLASTGANLSSVQSLTVGIENAGSGLVYVDDILLYRNAPAPVQGTDPGNASLVASYSMENNVNDDTGNYNGTTTGSPGFETGVIGQAVVLDGVDDFVDLPIGSLIASLSDITVASWANWSGEGGAWQRIFDFGTGETANMFLTPNSGAGTVRFAITTGGSGAESLVEGLGTLPTDWHHVAVTIDSSTMNLTLYVDGSVVGSAPTELLPQDLGETTQNWLGDSQYAADPFYNGALDEFLIYDRALSEAEIRYLAGEQ